MFSRIYENLYQNVRPWHVLIFFVFVVCVLYAPVFGYPFVHDDGLFIVNNPDIGRWNFRDVFMSAEDFGTNGQDVVRYYRPILEIVNRVIYAVFGMNPAAFHGFNIFLHAVNAWMVFLVMKVLLNVVSGGGQKNFWTSFAAGLLFLIHPVQTQAVCAIAGSSNLVVAFFVLSAFVCYLKIVKASAEERTAGFWSGFLFCFGAALLSKEQAVVFVPLVLMFEILRRMFLKDASWAVALKIISGLVGVTAVYVLWKHFAVGAHTIFFDDQSGGWQRILSIPHILWINMSLLAVPRDLHYFRSLDLFADHLWPTLGFIGALGGILWMAFIAKTTERFFILAGLAWFLVAQATTLQIVPIFWEYSHMSVAEHFLYLPSVGFLMMAAGLFQTGYQKASKSARILAGILLVVTAVVLCLSTVHSASFWKSELHLFERAAFYEPRLGRVQHLLSKSYVNHGRLREAAKASLRSLEIMTGYEKDSVGETAKNFYRMNMAESMTTLAIISYQAGDIKSAIDWMLKALDINPDDPALYSHLGIFYALKGDILNAESHMRISLKLDPQNAIFLRNYVFFLKAQGRAEETVPYLERLLKVDPGDISAQNELKNLRAE